MAAEWTPEQQRGCGALVLLVVFFGLLLPLSALLWQLALGWR